MGPVNMSSRVCKPSVNHSRALVVLAIAFGAFAFAGCSTTAPPPETAATKQVLANFDLSQCQQLDANLYKCPAVDKPICNPDYSGALECVRIGKKGGVFIQGPIED